MWILTVVGFLAIVWILVVIDDYYIKATVKEVLKESNLVEEEVKEPKVKKERIPLKKILSKRVVFGSLFIVILYASIYNYTPNGSSIMAFLTIGIIYGLILHEIKLIKSGKVS